MNLADIVVGACYKLDGITVIVERKTSRTVWTSMWNWNETRIIRYRGIDPARLSPMPTR